MKSILLVIDNLPRTYRFLLAILAGGIVFFLLHQSRPASISFLFSWISFAGLLLIFSWITILMRHPGEIGKIAKAQDTSLLLVFFIVVSAAFISLFAIILLLPVRPIPSAGGLSLHIVLSLVAVSLSWLLIHSLFTIRYAHIYYGVQPNEKNEAAPAGGLLFPGHAPPDFLDFAYFSFILAMTFQTADVSITSRRIRRLSLAHSLLSFVYNTTIIALIINIISALIGSR